MLNYPFKKIPQTNGTARNYADQEVEEESVGPNKTLPIEAEFELY